MSDDNDNPTPRDVLRDLIDGAATVPETASFGSIQATDIAHSDSPIDTTHLNDEVVAWLEDVTQDGSKVYTDKILFQTDDAQFRVRAEDDTVILEREDND